MSLRTDLYTPVSVHIKLMSLRLMLASVSLIPGLILSDLTEEFLVLYEIVFALRRQVNKKDTPVLW